MDYTQFKEKDSKEAAADKSPKLLPGANRWWLATDELLPASVMSACAAIVKADRGRIDGYNTYAKLYGTYTPNIWNGYQLTNTGKPTAPMRDRLTYNIIQSCIDTFVAMMVQNRPKPMFLTSDGDSMVERRAKKLDAFCYGQLYENDIYEMGPMALRDGAVFGEGILHPYVSYGKMLVERVLPYEILVDYLESHYGPKSTKSMHRIKNMDRTELADAWPEHKKLIMELPGTAYFLNGPAALVVATGTVVQSWVL